MLSEEYIILMTQDLNTELKEINEILRSKTELSDLEFGYLIGKRAKILDTLEMLDVKSGIIYLC